MVRSANAWDLFEAGVGTRAECARIAGVSQASFSSWIARNKRVESPHLDDRAAQHAEVVERVRAAMPTASLRDLAAACRVDGWPTAHPSTVSIVMARLDLLPTGGHRGGDSPGPIIDRVALDRCVDAVRNGASVSEALKGTSFGHATLARACAKADVKIPTSTRGHTKGRSAEAWRIYKVEGGTLSECARRVGVSVQSLSMWIKRNKPEEA